MAFFIFFTLATFLTSILSIYYTYKKHKLAVYITKPLVMIWILSLAIVSAPVISTTYKYLMILALFCSLVGDVFLMLTSDKFFEGLVSFLFAHFCFIAAFIAQYPPELNALLYSVPFFVYGGIMLKILYPDIHPKLRIPVIFYMTALLSMGWLAFYRFCFTQDLSSLLAFYGALFFIISDSVLGFDRFKLSFKPAKFIVFTTYFFSQWLMALSIYSI